MGNMIVKGSWIELIPKNLSKRDKHNSKDNFKRLSPLPFMGRRKKMQRLGY